MKAFTLHSTRRILGTIAIASALGVAVAPTGPVLQAAVAQAAEGYPSDSAKPDLAAILSDYNTYWISEGSNNLHGKITEAGTPVLQRNDELTSWINQNATDDQRYKALQDSNFSNQWVTVGHDGLGEVLGKIFVQGHLEGKLPKLEALLNGDNGIGPGYLGTGAAKNAFSYPRPYLNVDPAAAPVEGDQSDCAPSKVNGSSLKDIRAGRTYTDAEGNLKITRVAPATDDATYGNDGGTLDPAYGEPGICTGGSFPSGHTTDAYQMGITLATLVPELAPELLSRASEAGNNRIVLGVHYPMDIMGGRISGEATVAARWNDERYRTEVIEPARQELVSYLEQECGDTIVKCAASGKSYSNDSFAGKALPGGTSQQVTDRGSAVSVYRERMTYGFTQTGATDRPVSVPESAPALLITAFPTLNNDQRRQVLEQTAIASGYPLDSAEASWQRLDLAAATSATVQLNADGSVKVTTTGGRATVVNAPADNLSSGSSAFAWLSS
ncbi:phosphatase PAP2 family protein [Corynebacterium pacaense]|uniref:phosphatase PAP2 family protein n=1 Tax=Corynebacterium pacaense TaxID=1816684 RepID=UPI0009BA5E80|nr:phosphatase PAP2 family protein [Corynebacterium pacaense]